MLWISIFLIFVAEPLLIGGEMFAARLSSWTELLKPQNFKLFFMAIIGATLLLFGYALGYQSTKSIWIISAVSVTAILLVEPLLAYIFFHQLPEKGALVGLLLGAVGLCATVVWR